MAQYIVTDTELQAVADAIRAKLGSSDSLEWPSDFVDGIDDITGGGSSVPAPIPQGYVIYGADGSGNTQQFRLYSPCYLVAYFDDNMSSTYTLNGENYQLTTGAGAQQTLATTKYVSDQDSIIINDESGISVTYDLPSAAITFFHGDSGSYISVIAAWVGYPADGTIYEHIASGTTNTITLNSAHDKLLIFVGACGSLSNYTDIDINGETYTINNIGNHYGQIGMYGFIVIDNNSDTSIEVTLPTNCYSYVSIIGLD